MDLTSLINPSLFTLGGGVIGFLIRYLFFGGPMPAPSPAPAPTPAPVPATGNPLIDALIQAFLSQFTTVLNGSVQQMAANGVNLALPALLANLTPKPPAPPAAH